MMGFIHSESIHPSIHQNPSIPKNGKLLHNVLMIDTLRDECAKKGFDLCDPIHTQWYNDLIEEEGHVAKGTLLKLPEPSGITMEGEDGHGDHGGISFSYNAVLIGNSKSIWPKFIDWLSLEYERKLKHVNTNNTNSDGGDDDPKEEEKERDERDEQILNQVLNGNPFDTFVTESLSQVFQSYCCNCSSSDTVKASQSLSLASYEFYWSNGVHSKVDLEEEASGGGGGGDSSTSGCGRPQSVKEHDDDYHCYANANANANAANENENDTRTSTTSTTSFLVSMQRVAKVTGKYWHDEEGTKLCVHPTFGTWKAFRAVIVFYKKDTRSFDLSSSRTRTVATTSRPKAPPMCTCPVDPDEIQKAKEVMEYALKMSVGENATNTNTSNVGLGYGGKSNDLCTYLHNSVTSGSDWSKVSPTMRPWLQLRDCISVGRDDYKYCDNQLLYHYTKDTAILKRELLNL